MSNKKDELIQALRKTVNDLDAWTSNLEEDENDDRLWVCADMVQWNVQKIISTSSELSKFADASDSLKSAVQDARNAGRL